MTVLTLDEAEALAVLHLLSPTQVQEVAWAAQADGHDGSAIRTLAAYEWSTWAEIGGQLARALVEAGRGPLSETAAARRLAAPVAARIVRGELSPIDGASEIAYFASAAEYCDRQLNVFVQLTDEYDHFREAHQRREILDRIVSEARDLARSTDLEE
jgi:hypothetical protein